MRKPSTLLWMVIILLFVFPTPAGKVIFDLAGGIFLVIATIPLILGGVGWIAWKGMQSQLKTCNNCGTSFLKNQIVCPICGTGASNIKDNLENIPASAVTIDIEPEGGE